MLAGPLSFILGVFLSLTVLPAYGQESCFIRGEANTFLKCLTTACSTEERTRSVVFPDGRIIYVIGHDHANRDQLMEEMLELKNSKASTYEIRKKLREILAENKIASQNAELDIEFIKRFLFNRNAVNSATKVRTEVGVEALQSDLHELRRDLRSLREYFAEQGEFVQEDKRDAEHSLLTVFGPQLYLESTQAALFKNANLRGFESQLSVAKARQIEERREAAFRDLLEKYKNEPQLLNRLHEARRNFIQLAENYNPPLHNNAVMNSFRTAEWPVSSERKVEILNWVKIELELLSARRNRDRVVAERMAKGKGSQVILAGSMHLNSLARFLREECLKEAATNRVPTISIKPLPPIGTEASAAR